MKNLIKYISLSLSFAFSRLLSLLLTIRGLHEKRKLKQRHEVWRQEWYRQFQIQEKRIQRKQWIKESKLQWQEQYEDQVAMRIVK